MESMNKRQGHEYVRHLRSTGKEITLGDSFPLLSFLMALFWVSWENVLEGDTYQSVTAG